MTTQTLDVAALPSARYAVRFGRARDLIGVESLAQASAVVSRAVDAHMAAGGGGTTFPKVRVLDGQTLKVVATVSWNGRVWPPGRWTTDTEALFDPRPVGVRPMEALAPGSPAAPGRQPLLSAPKSPSCEPPAEIPAVKETTMSKSKKTKKIAAPKPATTKAPREKRPRAPKADRARDPRLPSPGTVIERVHKGQTLKIEVLEQGFKYDGKEWRSSTALAKQITGAKAISGPRFLGYDRPAETPPATTEAPAATKSTRKKQGTAK